MEDVLVSHDNCSAVGTDDGQLDVCGVCGSSVIEDWTHRCINCQIRHLTEHSDANTYYRLLDELNTCPSNERCAALEVQLLEFEQRPNW